MSISYKTEAALRWESLRTVDTQELESRLRTVPSLAGAQVDAYRLGPVTIRLRIVDPRFERLDSVEREDLVMPILVDDNVVRPELREDLMWLFLLAPSELETSHNLRPSDCLIAISNHEFEDPH
jgi:hypothetical protein